MDSLLILTYAAICIVLFKVFKIPLNKWSIPTAVLGGIVFMGGLILTLNYNHPYAEISRQYFISTPIVPHVTGEVIEVAVKGHHQSLEKGDVLFRLDPTPFQYTIKGLEARIELANADIDRANSLFQRNAGSKRDFDLASATLNDLHAQLAQANYQLEQTTERAPADGYVTQVALWPGMRVSNIPQRPVMIFIATDEQYLIGWFSQNTMLRLEVGSEAEVAFDGIPGTVFSAEVKSVLPALAEGQVQASGDLVSPAMAPLAGQIPVLIHITDERFEKYAGRVPGGAYAQSAIYSKHFQHIAIVRKILLRMSAWVDYLFPFH